METLKGEVLNVIFYNPENEFVVAKIKENRGEEIIITGNLGQLLPGEEITLKGLWTHHPRFGRQFKASECTHNFSSSAQGIKRYLSSNLVKGIGPVLADRIVKRFKEKTLEVLDKNPDLLLEVEGIGDKKLSQIKNSWDEQKEIRNIILFLQSYNISPSFAPKIFKNYGMDAIKKIKENPYSLAYDIRGIGFKTADAIALKLGFSEDSIERVEAGIVYTLFQLSEKGHTYYPKKELFKEVEKLIKGLDQQKFDEAVSELEDKKRIVTFETDEGVSVALRSFYNCESEIASRILSLILNPSFSIPPEKIKELISEEEKNQKINLSEEQKEAILKAIQNKVFVLTGGPGTGKTTITKFMVSIFNKAGLKIKLAAPTGRASKRLSEATSYPSYTIHRLLGYSPKEGFLYNETKKLNVDVLIVDEMSMVDSPLFLHLLRAIPISCRLILIGDVNQLPSVGPGKVLWDLLESEKIPYVSLKKIYRQAKNSTIIVNAHRINEGKFPIKDERKPPKAEFFWVEKKEPEIIQKLILHLIEERIPKVYGLDPKRDVQLLTPMHKGILGTIEMNKLLQERLNPNGISISYGTFKYRVGDKVIQTKNNYEKEIFNGDLGWIKEIDLEEGIVKIQFDERELEYLFSELDEISLAYAISIHKSQGSEYPCVIVPVVIQHYLLLQRNLIYTAITRAKKLAILIGEKRALAIGIKNEKREKRYTNLKAKIEEIWNKFCLAKI